MRAKKLDWGDGGSSGQQQRLKALLQREHSLEQQLSEVKAQLESQGQEAAEVGEPEGASVLGGQPPLQQASKSELFVLHGFLIVGVASASSDRADKCAWLSA